MFVDQKEETRGKVQWRTNKTGGFGSEDSNWFKSVRVQPLCALLRMRVQPFSAAKKVMKRMKSDSGGNAKHNSCSSCQSTVAPSLSSQQTDFAN